MSEGLLYRNNKFGQIRIRGSEKSENLHIGNLSSMSTESKKCLSAVVNFPAIY